ncbi:hypothetical protein [Bacteroides sp. GM023]|uniref:hypothetical protein n=1 Tax=Bacteroides sp. GM023 TaxID=2723058 RepID=UPI00168B0795|nr:hypothetical protein [Bacteroides sp. GM023]MBD3591441.1 hypothetical protein [Bacteroides sp. GM023]
MDTEHTMCPKANPTDTVVDQSAESLLIDSISSEEMTALKAYFERLAQEMLSSSRCKLNSGDDLPHYLFRKLEKSKALFSSLELPWERYIPILYQAFSLYFIHMNEPNTRLKALKLTSELMSAVVLLSQSGRLINQLTTFCHEESEMLKKWMDENKK